jgi:hypothetical protein
MQAIFRLLHDRACGPVNYFRSDFLTATGG